MGAFDFFFTNYRDVLMSISCVVNARAPIGSVTRPPQTRTSARATSFDFFLYIRILYIRLVSRMSVNRTFRFLATGDFLVAKRHARPFIWLRTAGRCVAAIEIATTEDCDMELSWRRDVLMDSVDHTVWWLLGGLRRRLHYMIPSCYLCCCVVRQEVEISFTV